MSGLRETLHNLLAETLNRREHKEHQGTVSPPVDIYETPLAFDLECSLLGIKPSEMNLTVHGNTVTISGEFQADTKSAKEEGRWILQERESLKYSRKITLGCSVDSTKVVASSENGVLKLHLPKAENERPKRISIA
jgi:HSP20 family protein